MAFGTQGKNFKLAKMQDCYIRIGDAYIYMNNLPDISDSHDASYGEENGIGRSMPIKTFGQGGNRTISWTVTFIADTDSAASVNMQYLRLLQSCTYPREESGSNFPYVPPPVVHIRCGELLSVGNSSDRSELCCVLKNYSVKFPKDVPWQDTTYIPYKFDVSLSFEVVYSTEDMPGQERIFTYGS